MRIALWREQSLLSRLQDADPGEGGILFDTARDPATITDFDPRAEALLVQLPAEQMESLVSDDFTMCPSEDGAGQDLMYRNRLVLRLPKLSPRQKIELYVQPMPG